MKFLFAAVAMYAVAANAQRIEEAQTAYRANRIAEAEAVLGAIVANPAATPADRTAALRQSSRIAWRIDGDYGRALQALRAAEAIGADGCGVATDLARLLQEAERSGELMAQADALAAGCTEPGSADALLMLAAEAALDHAANGAGRHEALARAEALLAAAGEDARASLGGAALDLQLALLRGDARRALQAWRNYFWLRDAILPPGIAPGPGAGSDPFAPALADNGTAEARLALIDLLVRAGFAREAERFAASTGVGAQAGQHPLWRRASAYFDARRELETALLANHRAIARGRPSGDVAALYRRFAGTLVRAAGREGDERTILRDAYGLYGQTGGTGGFPGINLGHVIEDGSWTVDQYGHRADIRFVALDNMIANGFQSWLWDGFAAVGGWTEDGPIIVQVRPGFVSGPLRLWRLSEGGRARTELLARQPALAAADIAALAGRDSAALPGLGDRLMLQIAERIGDKSRLAGGDLRRAFLEEAWRASFNQSMLVHEGRHAIDRRLVIGAARMDDANLEYRAMLSELAFADYPRLGLYNMVVGSVGDGSPYGAAKARIIRELAAWAVANRQRVPGFDPSQPAAVQLDRLTDEQLRAAARSLDPIAR